MQNKPTPEEVKNARVAAGLTLKEAADIFVRPVVLYLLVNISIYCY